MYAFANVLLALLLIYAGKIVPKKTRAVPQNYDVFLSFRGEDTRTGFTDFLYISLVDAGFLVFRDNDALPVGKEIGLELLQAIRNCQIAIPIISERYAQSKPCLRELNEIMDCHTKHRKSVFPVFYKVDVVDVLEQRGIFGKALREHRRHCSSRDVQNWELALTSVAGIRGWTSQAIANGHEGELVKMVVAKVSSVLKTRWIERLLIFSMLMSYYRIRSVYLYFSEKKRSEVFLAFHGPDTRCGFAAHLCSSLMDARINVFRIDDPSLIAQIVECKKTKGQEMLPIFYKVKSSDVKELLNSFGGNMRQQKKLFKRSKYKQWKQVLREVGSSKGWESGKIANGHEGVLVKQIVKKVLRLLMNPQTHDGSITIH